MSSIDPFVPGATLLQYHLAERLSPSVWKAEDTRSGKAVAIKVLARQLPRDAAKRDALVREVRVNAALYHTSIINIIEIVPAGDALIMAMELVPGENLAAFVRGKALDRTTFFRIAYQCADALRLLHAKNVVHGSINADSILVAPSGLVKIGGFNISTFLQKREGQPSAFQLRGSDARAVAYMAPEQITGQPTTPQTDLYSLGLVLYEMAVGKPAYSGNSAAEVARKAVNEQPPNPKVINPNIDNAMLAVTGRCLFKDPYRRYKDAKALVDDINRADADVAAWVAELGRSLVAPLGTASAAKSRNSILLLADIADYDRLEAEDSDAANKAASRMQQLVGEAAYLFDGEIVDPFGPRVIAELPSIESALEAGRKAEFDFSPDQQEGEHIPVRMILHAGDVTTTDGHVVGDAIDKGFAVLHAMPPLKLLITEEFAKKARGSSVRLRDAGARAGTKLYEILPPEPQEIAATEIHTAELEEQARAETAALEAAALVRKRTRTRIAIAAATVFILALGAGALLWLKSRKPAQTVVAVAPLPPATTATPRRIFIEPLATEGSDPQVSERARAVRLASMEVLRSFRELRVADSGGTGVTSFTAKLTPTQIVAAKHPPVPATDSATAVEALVHAVTSDVNMAAPAPMNPAAVNAFADAVVAFSVKDNAKTETSIRAAVAADPKFLPAQLLAMRFFDVQGRDADAVAAAKEVVALDPQNPDAARKIGRAALSAGDVGGALGSFSTVLKSIPTDVEALNVIGRYAVAVPEPAKFAAVLSRVAPMYATVHEPDLLLANGRIDEAVSKLYTIERANAQNPALCLKIGRIAVLRHSSEIAGIELGKLQGADPAYGAHVLKAYIAASTNARGEAAAELKTAQAASVAGDDFFTCSAEVAAIAGDARGTIDALEKAAARKEPTAAYILNNPLFRFLSSDARYQKVRDALAAEQSEVRTALSNIAL